LFYRPYIQLKMLIIAFCGPSGSGKSTLIKRIVKEFPNQFVFCVSHTSRELRVGEVDGREYYFVSRAKINTLIKNNEFVEYGELAGNLYLTSKQAVKNVFDSGRVCLIDIEIQGVAMLRNSNLNSILCFVKTSCLSLLEQRLRIRNTETERSLQQRLERARYVNDYTDQYSNMFDYTIVNDGNFEDTFMRFKEILFKLNLIS
jgi:guanylate kinase